MSATSSSPKSCVPNFVVVVQTYMGDPEHMLFAIGSVVGPHPFPGMVRDFQAIVGYEAKEQFQELTGGKPDVLLACVGGGCNSLGLFTAFLDDPDVKLIGVEPAGHGLDKGEGHHSATMTLGKPAVLHGMKCYTLLNAEGEPASVHSVRSLFLFLAKLSAFYMVAHFLSCVNLHYLCFSFSVPLVLTILASVLNIPL